MYKFRYAGDAWNFLRTMARNRALWTVVYFERRLCPASDYYVFISSPYVGNQMHAVAQKVLEYRGVQCTPANRHTVAGLTRKFSDGFRDTYFLGGGDEVGGHAEEHFVRQFYRFYSEVILNRPDTAIILNSDSPCTLADRLPSGVRVARRPNNPAQQIRFGASCTAKLNMLASLVGEIPNWEVYYRKKYGAYAARTGPDAVLISRDAAETQILTAQNISINRFTDGMEMTCRQYGVP